ncbi:MAG: peptidylprolyl isomerase [Anaerolineales bacterium]
MRIGKDHAVHFHYTLTDDSGKVLDDSHDSEPLGYLHGHDNIITGLEAALEGREAGDEFVVTVEADDAYGQRNEDLVEDVPASLFEGVDDVQVGMQFMAQGEDAEQLVTVTGVEDDQVTIDANHPLAGERLNFAVEITEVRAATDTELRHGHVHSGDHEH